MSGTGRMDIAGIGARLQAAREAAGWTREQVALKLRLSTQQVAALEAGDTISLPPAAYVRGYLRNYAQLLGLDPREFVVSATSVLPASPPRAKSVLRALSGWRPRWRSGWAPVSYGALFVLVGLLGFWWHRRHESVHPAAHAVAADGRARAGLPPRLVALALPGTTHGQLSRFPLTKTHPRRPHTQAAARPSAPPHRLQSGTKAHPMPVSSSRQSQAVVAATASPGVRVPPSAADTVPNPGGLVSLPLGRRYSTLVIAATTGRCWVAVRDASGRRLAFGLIHRGQSLRLVGVAPFRVSFGKPQGVRVDINGRPVPLPSVRPDQVLRMMVRSQPG